MQLQQQERQSLFQPEYNKLICRKKERIPFPQALLCTKPPQSVISASNLETLLSYRTKPPFPRNSKTGSFLWQAYKPLDRERMLNWNPAAKPYPKYQCSWIVHTSQWRHSHKAQVLPGPSLIWLILFPVTHLKYIYTEKKPTHKQNFPKKNHLF